MVKEYNTVDGRHMKILGKENVAIFRRDRKRRLTGCSLSVVVAAAASASPS